MEMTRVAGAGVDFVVLVLLCLITGAELLQELLWVGEGSRICWSFYQS